VRLLALRHRLCANSLPKKPTGVTSRGENLGQFVHFTLSRLGQVSRRIVDGNLGSLTVLSYHRVGRKAGDSFEQWPDADGFRQQIRWLKEFCQVVDLAEGIRRVCVDGMPGHFGAISFDDGYQDNYDVAVPVLKSEGINATFFIATSYLSGNAMFNDIVYSAVTQTTLLEFGWASLSVEVRSLSDCSKRKSLAKELIEKLKYLPPNVRDATALEIAKQLGGTVDQNLMMSKRSLADLFKQGMSVGSHTHRHLVATTVTLDEFAADIQNSIDELIEITGQKPELFAFPNGKSNFDQTDEYVNLVRKSGFSAALTTDLGSNFNRSDLFTLKRFTPWAQSRFGFKQQLKLSSWGVYNES
jgi:peptidoglycan/xylan/chitin deacetylase (PgdA/CDA1 family)